MIRRTFIYIALFLPIYANGQHINDSLLLKMYDQTLISYFSDTSNHSNQHKFEDILIFTNFSSAELISQIGAYSLVYHARNRNYQEILEKPLKKNNGRFVYVLDHKIIADDTVELNLNGITIVEINRKTTTTAIWCGGTVGYIPTAKFIFNRSQNDWIFYDRDSLIKIKYEEEGRYR